MISIDSSGLEVFLPKYLSPETQEKLLSDLSDFPQNIDQRMFGFYGKDDNVIYQGDCIKELSIINLPDTKIEKACAVVLSNTCDIDTENKRKYSSNIIYSPIIALEKYIAILKAYSQYSDKQVSDHIADIRKQRVTQIFYFPISSENPTESLIFFDRLCSCNNNIINRGDLSDLRMFSLSQYGFYLFLYKLSIHFTRLHENVDRVY